MGRHGWLTDEAIDGGKVLDQHVLVGTEYARNGVHSQG